MIGLLPPPDRYSFAEVARIVVIADLIFTATAVVLQPITGVWLAVIAGSP
jgi:uncharacterized membrane protein